MPKKMTITANAIVPPTEHAARGESVEIAATVDCTVMFGDGLGVVLKKNESCFVTATSDGPHFFWVRYPEHYVDIYEKSKVSEINEGRFADESLLPESVHVEIYETAKVTGATSSGAAVATETIVMTTRSLSGPTGNILVP